MIRRLIWNAIAAALLTCFMPPLLELTTFEHLWSFLPMLFLPLLLSHLARRYFLLGSLAGLLLSFYLILTPGSAPWGIFTEISSDIRSVINGELPGRPAFALSIGLISFLIAYLARRSRIVGSSSDLLSESSGSSPIAIPGRITRERRSFFIRSSCLWYCCMRRRSMNDRVLPTYAH